jgi:hypothetical protein
MYKSKLKILCNIANRLKRRLFAIKEANSRRQKENSGSLFLTTARRKESKQLEDLIRSETSFHFSLNHLTFAEAVLP